MHNFLEICWENCCILPELCRQSVAGIDFNCRCISQLRNTYTVLFQRQGHETIPALPLEDVTPLNVPTFTSPPIPLAYNDPIFSVRMARASHQQEEEEIQPLREENSITEADKQDHVNYANYNMKENCNDNDKLKAHSKGGKNHFGSSDDEDVCPTCLEEYTEENPKIVMQCSHDFHLGCIYEWMERSEACPVCGKKMVFSESD